MDDSFENLKYCAARSIYSKRNKMLSAKVNGSYERITWKAWWSQKFNEDYDQYVSRKTLERVQQARISRDEDNTK